ncbi:molybdopterin molybdotransferase MoeA [Curvivirga aplysinae]|uniref:molybdopterin molybdotransferase MoeA n=1 Tax=Curvivirga aplysinae TaxID=2529852 RepID=UPI0012BCA3AD|nr:gephyrin-like molybdotransferase Glp [Curvivirga aplysinae]MTI10221.1 molybdopterin molybdenumtransferase MoeA [Curvivirga aplysinae]
MAQLTDSCFDAGGELLPLEKAIKHLKENLLPVAQKVLLPLAECQNHVLAEDIIANHNVPPHNNSAVDGYAVRFSDLSSSENTILPVGARIAAGQFLGRPLAEKEAIRIFTGAPMPEGADTVMMQEDTVEADGKVTLLPGIKLGANSRNAGEDMQAGKVVLKAGQKLSAPQIAIAAAQGYAILPVYKKLSIALFSSGDEVNEPGTDLPKGGIFDANRPMLLSLLEGWGCDVTDLGILPDDPKAMEEAFLKTARDHDLLVSSAGMSVGEEDHLCNTIKANGNLNFWKLAIKPGRPVGMGLLQQDGKSTPVLGLPGNPVAAFLTCNIVGRVIIQILSGMSLKFPMRFPSILAEDIKKKAGREEYLRCSLTGDTNAAGLPYVKRFGKSGAAILSSLEGADGFMLLRTDLENPKTDQQVFFLPIEGLLTL